MKILLLSFYFPPFNTIGAVRVGKLAKHLGVQGHDIRVVAADNLAIPKTLPLDVPVDRVLYTPWLNINRLPEDLARIRRRLLGPHPEVNPETGRHEPNLRSGQYSLRETRPSAALRAMDDLYRNLLNWPDNKAGWLPPALSGSRRYLADWSPDLIYASSPPPTSLVLGHLLSRRLGAPWVAEFRDRWSDDRYYPRPAWRMGLERRLERHIVSSAAGIVSVSEPWAENYRAKYAKPTAVIYNGIDLEDGDNEPGEGSPDSPYLRLVYTGGIYPGMRDPTPVFRALQLLDAEGDNVRMEFFGTEPGHVFPLAERYGVEKLITVRPHIPFKESMAVQRQGDILLLMQWNDPSEQGNIPGKLFEYLAARRPILGLGLETGVSASIIRDRCAGVFTNDPQAIADCLTAWLVRKRTAGHIAPLPESVQVGFSRAEQFGKLETFLSGVLGSA